MNTSFYSDTELQQIGFASVGKNVMLSRKASIYGASRIHIGDNCRIDDYALLSGKINISNNVHIGAYSALYAGQGGINIHDFVGISARCTIWAKSDDYSGKSLFGPCVPSEYTHVIDMPLTLEKYVVLGCNAIILPGANIAEGCAIGAASLVRYQTLPWKVYAGIPAKILKDRSRELLNLVSQLEK